MRKWGYVLFFFLGGEILANQELELYVKQLSQKIRCPVCQGQTVEDSNAPLALALKKRIREGLQKGEDEEEILRQLEKQYGSRILLRPPLQPSTYFLWFSPFLFAGALGIIFGYKAFSRRHKLQN